MSSSRSGHPLSITKAEMEALAPQGPTSLVDRIFMLVAGRIQSGQAAAGTRLPSVRKLAEDCEISRDTAARAYDKLVAHGLVESRRGSGFYAKSASRRAPIAQSSGTVFSGLTGGGDSRSRIRLLRTDAVLQTRTGSGVLPEDWLDESALGGALRAVARASLRNLAHHGDPKGYLPLRQQLQIKLHEMGIQADARNIVSTNGASEALHLVVQGYLREPGECVLVEEPGPMMLTDRLLSTGLELLPVPRLADGPDLAVLRAQCEKHSPRFFFVSSVLHNPTCTQLAPHKAFQLLQLAEEFDLTLVEDDTYGDLMPLTGAPVVRLAPLDQLERVIYIGSFSKTLAPGLRCGFLAASPKRIEWLTTYRVVSMLAGSALAERVVYRLLSQGGYRHHCDQLRTRLERCRPVVIEAARKAGLTLEHVPEAGLFLWAHFDDLKLDARRVAERMLEQGHLLAAGRLFSVNPHHRAFLRLNIAESMAGPMLPALAKLLGR